jgi:hypothetical protein
MVENIAYKPGGWEPRVDDEGMRGKGNWSNEGYLGPGVLKPGEFGVRELGPNERIQNYGFDGGADANTIFLRLPEGMASLDKTRIEIGTREKFLRVLNKNNLVWRNIVVEGFASYWGGTALEVEWFWSGRDNHDWLFEGCDFRFNGGVACAWTGCAPLRCGAVRSGATATTGCRASRATRSSKTATSPTTARAMRATACGSPCRTPSSAAAAPTATRASASATTTRATTSRLRTAASTATRVRAASSSRSRRGRSPCAAARWRATKSRDAHHQRQQCFAGRLPLHRERGAQVFIEADKRNTHLLFLQAGTNVPLEYPYMKNWKVENCLFVARGEGSSIWSKIWWGGSPPAYVDWFKNEFSGRGNRYWSPDTPRPFNVSSAWDRKDWVWTDLAGWKAATGSDENSVWGPPQQ